MIESLLARWLPNVDWQEIGYASLDTLNMLGGATLFTVLLGLPLGVLLFLTGPRQMFEQRALYAVLSLVVNVLRSVPFVILLILMIPLTVLITGTSLGVAGAIPPLVVGATPFFARLVETALREVDRGIIEATQAMGATTLQIIFRALLPEALPGLIAATTVTAITLVSYTAMSGLIGGGGLGDLAVRYGYQRYQPDVMAVTVILLLVLEEVGIQAALGNLHVGLHIVGEDLDLELDAFFGQGRFDELEDLRVRYGGGGDTDRVGGLGAGGAEGCGGSQGSQQFLHVQLLVGCGAGSGG